VKIMDEPKADETPSKTTPPFAKAPTLRDSALACIERLLILLDPEPFVMRDWPAFEEVLSALEVENCYLWLQNNVSPATATDFQKNLDGLVARLNERRTATADGDDNLEFLIEVNRVWKYIYALDGFIKDGAARWSPEMHLTDIADRVYKNPRAWRRLKKEYLPQGHLEQVGNKGSKNWMIRLDILPESVRAVFDKP
jgi:hypothetical protein